MELEDNPSILAIEEITKNEHASIIVKELQDICERGIAGNVLRHHHSNRIEDEFYTNYIKNSKGTLEEARFKLKKEEELSKELDILKRQELRTLKYKQHFREANGDLRNLESKIRAAYTQKEVAAQIAEKECFKKQSKLDALKENETLNKALYALKEKKYLEAQEAIQRKALYKQDLQNQMIMAHKRKQNDYEELMQEKKQIDAIVKRMNDEDIAKIEEKKYQYRKTQEEIVTFKAAQNLYKERAQKLLIEENKKFQESIKQREILAREKDKVKKATESAREQYLQNVAKTYHIKNEKKNEKDKIYLEYTLQEIERKQDERDQKEIDKRTRHKIEDCTDLAKQCLERKERENNEMLEDIRWRQALEDKDLEDLTKERNVEQKKRDNLISIRKENEITSNLKREQRVQELKTIAFYQEQDRLIKEEKTKTINNLRLEVLKQHAPNLIGYIQPKILCSEDLPKLGPEFVKYYSTRK